MELTRSSLMTLLVMMSACGFNPEGEGGPGDDALRVDAPAPDADDGDGPIAIDGAEIDAAMIDARVIDAPPPIDAPDIDARVPCPVGYNVTTLSGTYAFRAGPAVHAVASADCNDDLPGRTHLATYENEAAFDADIAAVNPGNNTQPYVGGVCTAIDCAVMSNWFWSTGPAIEVSVWETGQPNNGATQKAARAEREGNVWVLNNTESTQSIPYICECDP